MFVLSIKPIFWITNFSDIVIIDGDGSSDNSDSGYSFGY